MPTAACPALLPSCLCTLFYRESIRNNTGGAGYASLSLERLPLCAALSPALLAMRMTAAAGLPYVEESAACSSVVVGTQISSRPIDHRTASGSFAVYRSVRQQHSTHATVFSGLRRLESSFVSLLLFGWIPPAARPTPPSLCSISCVGYCRAGSSRSSL
jgi:hypothetical protein